MKKILKILFILSFLLLNYSALAHNSSEDVVLLPEKSLENDKKEILEGEKEVIYEEPILFEKEETPLIEKKEKEERYNPYTKEALKGIIEREYDLNSPSGLFKDQLTFKFKKGPIKEHTFELMTIHNFSENINDKDSNLNFAILPINMGFFGKFRSEKESYTIITDYTPNNHNNFIQSLILDAYIDSKRIKNHTLRAGVFRPSVGLEGARSAFLIPLSAKSQIARHFSNARKQGARVMGEFKYLDYIVEGFSSDIQFEEFFPGAEGVLWLNLKPLAKFDDKYGKLILGGGYQKGTRNSHDYDVASAALKYDYKNFWMTSEFANADGSNGTTGLTEAKRQGYNLTLAYRLTKKLELLARYDDFDNDKKIANNNTKEYTAGFNYYILGQVLRIIFNYVYCDNEAKADSHKIILGTQIAI